MTEPNFRESSEITSSYYSKYDLRPYNPAELFQKYGNYDLYDKMREDDQIWSCLALKKIITLNSNWEIKSDNDEVIEFIKWCFNNLDDIFIKKLYEIFSAYDYGVSITEKIAEYRDTPFGKKIVFKKLATRAPHTFEIHTDNFGNILKLIQKLNDNDLELDINNFIIFSYNKEFDNAYGQSDLNTGVYRAWWSKDAIIKFWNIYLERFSSPTVVGKVERGTAKAERDNFLTALKNIQSKTSLLIPAEFTIELLESSKSAGEFEAAIDKYNTIIARKLLIPDLLGFSGSKTIGGSLALGREQFDIFYTMRNYDRQQISNIINRDLIRPLLEWNYGKIEAEFVFNPIDEKEKQEMMKLWLEAIKTGKIPVNFDSVNWFLGEVKAPEIDKKEWDKQEEEKEEFKQGIIDKKESNKSDDTGDDKKEFLSIREYINYEKKTNFKNIEKKLDEIDTKYINEFSNAYLLAINNLKDEIKSKKIIENKRLDLINKLKLKYTGQRTALWKQCLMEAFLSGEMTVKYEIGLNNNDVADWINNNAFYTSMTEDETLLKQIKGTLIDSIRSGNSWRDTVTQIEVIAGKYDVKLKTGETLAERLDLIVTNNTAKAFNEARAIQFEQLGDEIIAYEYSAVIDKSTTSLCRSLNGKIFKPSELKYYNAPNHHRCRSLILPIFRDEKFNGYDKMPNTEQEDGGFLKLVKENEE